MLNYKKSDGPSCIMFAKAVVDDIHQHGHPKLVLLDEGASNAASLVVCLRLFDDEGITYRPFIRSMRFYNVHGGKGSDIGEIIEHLMNISHIGTERESGVGPRTEHERFPCVGIPARFSAPAKVFERCCSPIKKQKIGIWSVVA